jgi:antitoxin component of MazEF toxin-antitoxin module
MDIHIHYTEVFNMTTTTAVRQWGNSAGVRIPKEILEQSKIQIDDVLEVTASFNGSITLQKQGRKNFSDIAKPLVDTRGWKFNREEANER